MVLDRRFAMPPRLSRLVQLYADREERSVRIRLPSWTDALIGVPGNPTRLLADPLLTTESGVRHHQELDDRIVNREGVLRTCSSVNFSDDDAIIAAFVLVMAWSSGTNNAQSPSNTRRALRDVSAAAATLRESALNCRGIQSLRDPALRRAHQLFALPGVGEASFTKWLAFAGQSPQRSWQPLILDNRVRSTLHVTLDVWLNRLTERRSNRDRYVGYVAAMHQWAERLGDGVTAARLEWIMSAHNGRPI